MNEHKPLIVGVEPERCASMSAAMAAGYPVKVEMPGGGLHSSTSQLNLSRFWNSKHPLNA